MLWSTAEVVLELGVVGGGHSFPDLQMSFLEMLGCFADISTGYHFLMAGEAQVSTVSHSLFRLSWLTFLEPLGSCFWVREAEEDPDFPAGLLDFCAHSRLFLRAWSNPRAAHLRALPTLQTVKNVMKVDAKTVCRSRVS